MSSQIQLGEISIDVVFKNIKNVHLSVNPPTGQVRISAPFRMDMDTVRLFALAKLQWIKDRRMKFQAQQREIPREMLERESHYLWGKRYLMEVFEGPGPSQVLLDHKKLVLNTRRGASTEKRTAILDDFYRNALRERADEYLAKWEGRLGVSANRVIIQRMKTKWGSCNPTARNIRLNLELAKKPPECLDYVVLHELLHFFVPNHGDHFVDLMELQMPHWRIVRETLNAAPLAHGEWACR